MYGFVKGRLGYGTAKGGAKRHKKIGAEARKRLRKINDGKISRGGLLRLCRRAGIRRVAEPSYNIMRSLATHFLETHLHPALVFMISRGSKTIEVKDVLAALSRSRNLLMGAAAGYSAKDRKVHVAS